MVSLYSDGEAIQHASRVSNRRLDHTAGSDLQNPLGRQYKALPGGEERALTSQCSHERSLPMTAANSGVRQAAHDHHGKSIALVLYPSGCESFMTVFDAPRAAQLVPALFLTRS